MAKFYRTENGIGWLTVSWDELVRYSANPHPVCDECLAALKGDEDIILLPLLNEAYCSKCGKTVLSRMVNYEEDRPYAEIKELFWLKYFGIKEEVM